MNDIWQTVLAIIGSVGGAGIIIVGISSWIGKLWADKLMKKSEYSYQRSLETIRQDFIRKIIFIKRNFKKNLKYTVLLLSPVVIWLLLVMHYSPNI